MIVIMEAGKKIVLNKIDFIVAFLFMASSGNPLIIYSSEWFSVITMVIMFILCLFNKKTILTKSLIQWVLLLSMLFIVQYWVVDKVSIPADINLITKIITASLFATYLGGKFKWAYLHVIVALTAMSLICWTLSYIDPEFLFGYEYDRYYTIFFYNRIIDFNDNYDMYLRNSGMFWEPGAFAGFILFVPMLFFDRLKELYHTHKMYCYILLVGLLSTFSTTGYVVLIFLVGSIWINSANNMFSKMALFFFIAIISVYAFTGLDFLGAKITKQFEDAQNLSSGDYSWDRFGAMKIDIEYALKHPWIGNGFLLSSRYGQLGEYMTGTGNGFTGAINMFGFPLILFYFFSVYNKLPWQGMYMKIVIIISMVLLLSGEYYLNYSFFWVLLFVNYNPSLSTNYDAKN